MNKLLIATLSIGALTLGAANAADLRAPVKAPIAVAPACAQFGGFYFGGHGGYGYYRHDYADRGNLVQTIDSDLPTSANIADGNWHGGAQIGWNWQRNCTVFGVEADWSWSGMKASENFFDGDAGTQDALTVSSKLRWFGTVRTRAGIVVDNLLLYVTGGFATRSSSGLYVSQRCGRSRRRSRHGQPEQLRRPLPGRLTSGRAMKLKFISLSLSPVTILN